MIATFRPLQWTGPETPYGQRRSRSTFKAAWSDTLDLLDRELEHLDAENVVIQADFREGDIRVDGMPRANARLPLHPGVRIAFDSKHGPLVYATDAHEDWRHNVRAIALSLQALRSVDRYGVTKRAEQYKGWREIEAGPADLLSEAQARGVLAACAGVGWGRPTASVSSRDLYRAAAKRAHPDQGGSRAAWADVQRAREVLGVTGMSLPTNEGIGRRIKIRRVALGWSQTKLTSELLLHGAERFHQPTVQRVEDGSRPLRLTEALVFAEVLQVSLDYLTGCSLPEADLVEEIAHHQEIVRQAVALLQQPLPQASARRP